MGVRLAGFDYRIIVIAAEAAIQDGALPAASTAPPPPALHNGAPTHQAYRHCGEERAPYCTNRSGQPVPGLNFLDCGLRRNDDRGGISVGGVRRPGHDKTRGRTGEWA